MIRYPSRVFRVLLSAILSISSAAIGALPAQAPQPLRPTVFVHGLGNTSATWQETADRLAQDFAIQPFRPDLSSYSPFGTQAQQLRGFMGAFGLPPSTIGVGYSNGGIVSRKANADGQPFSGIVTAATPHQGAELARSIVSGRVTSFAQFVAFSLAAPFHYYAYYWDRDARYAYAWANVMYALVLYLDDLVERRGFLREGLVLPEMYPGSDFLAGTNGLNSAANLSREASALSRRVGITSVIDPDAAGYMGITWRGVVPDHWATVTSFHYKAIFVLLLVGEKFMFYDNDDDPDELEKRLGAFLWFEAAWALAVVDPMWCTFIGVSVSDRTCEPSDAIVPAYSQRYPGATRNRTLTGPAHLQVPNSSEAKAELALTLVEDFAVPRRVASVSASPASLSLTPGQTATITAIARDPFGNPEVAPIAWQSSNSSVATVNQSGVVSAAAAGNATVTAWAYNFSTDVPITVTTGPPLSGVTLSGPNEVPSGTMTQWNATPVGGLAPFTYTWRVNNTVTQTGTSASLSRRFFSSSQISVTVTDARGHTRSATMSVAVVGGCGTQRTCDE